MQLHEKGRQFPGTYVELGAFSGMHESNTRFFDECLGWEGLLIEGNPLKFIELIANRPFAHKMSMAPSCKKDGSSIQFHVSPFTNAGLEGKALAYANETTIDVPCGRFSPILAGIFRGKESINFLSLDVEGAENFVLDAMEFSAFPRIDILLIEIENNYCPPEVECHVRNDVRARMQSEGYLRYSDFIPRSDLYVHPQSNYQFARSETQPANSPRSDRMQQLYKLQQPYKLT
jgi:hypothetical protein